MKTMESILLITHPDTSGRTQRCVASHIAALEVVLKPVFILDTNTALLLRETVTSYVLWFVLENRFATSQGLTEEYMNVLTEMEESYLTSLQAFITAALGSEKAQDYEDYDEVVEDFNYAVLNASRLLQYPGMTCEEKAVFDKLYQNYFDDVGS